MAVLTLGLLAPEPRATGPLAIGAPGIGPLGTGPLGIGVSLQAQGQGQPHAPPPSAPAPSAVATPATLPGAAPAECFPFERLPAALRPKAEALLLQALDSEALYTIAGGLKPVSSGLSLFRVKIAAMAPADRDPVPPDVTKPDVAKPDVAKPDVAKPDVTKPDVAKPDVAKPDVAKSNVAKSNVAKPDVTAPDRTALALAGPDLAEVEQVREILQAWRCGDEIAAGVHHFAAVRDDVRALDVFVAHRPSLSRLLEDRRAFFGTYGLSASADPMEVILAIEYDATPARFRGYGYLFGYPSYAVDFFVEAAESEKRTGEFVKRDFLSIPTVRGETNRFVYAVPKGHQENDADRALKAAARVVYQDYVARRARHITGTDASGVIELVRTWFADGRGGYAPSRVRTAAGPTTGAGAGSGEASRRSGER